MITTENTEVVLLSLAGHRPVFHSEADFQHALAWSLAQSNLDAVVRLELPFRTDEASEYLDLLLASKSRRLAVELKYKTRRLSLVHEGETFELKNQGAQDLGRYDFLADVGRLERFVADGRASAGCAILLTNDSSYWAEPSRSNTVDEQFRLTEGRVVEGTLAWRSHASEGTMRGREKAISLRGKYTVAWMQYSNPSQLPSGEFRCLVWHVA